MTSDYGASQIEAMFKSWYEIEYWKHVHRQRTADLFGYPGCPEDCFFCRHESQGSGDAK